MSVTRAASFLNLTFSVFESQGLSVCLVTCWELSPPELSSPTEHGEGPLFRPSLSLSLRPLPAPGPGAWRALASLATRGCHAGVLPGASQKSSSMSRAQTDSCPSRTGQSGTR